ncbi:hypothetical protein RB195_005233 [Necator americanus]|uniref:Uncharacterized protein n=1 Tax=Necator americanus TaxID=51031 RepID=A0ABR1BLU2_NECAM
MVFRRKNKKSSTSNLTSLTQSTTHGSITGKSRFYREESWVKVNPRLEPQLDGEVGEVMVSISDLLRIGYSTNKAKQATESA